MVGHDAASNDPCFVAMAPAISTVGCNSGYVTTEPAANAPLGTCTPDTTMMRPQGSCTVASDRCTGAMMAATTGYCVPSCTPPAMTYSSTSTCPRGSRCFPLMGGGGACFRDCNASHPCPAGGACDGDGSCPLAMGG